MKKTKFRRLTTLILSLVMLCTGFTLQSSAQNLNLMTLEGTYLITYDYVELCAFNGYAKDEIVITDFYHPATETTPETRWTVADELGEINYYNNLYASEYPNAYRIKNADLLYNAHFYSFFCQDGTDLPMWVDTPMYYLSPYQWQYEVYYDFRPRDIVCYFDDNDTPDDTSDDALLHSGIISGYSTVTQSNGQCGDIDLYMVDSKWGFGGVYRHNGYECPYTNYYNPGNEVRADYVRCFRFPNHEVHAQQEPCTYEQHNSVLHQSICSCGQIIYEPHDLQRVSIDYGMNSVTPEVGLNAIVPPVLEELVCVDCGYRP